MLSLICFALKEEAAPFRKIAVGKSNVSILITGVGRKNAEMAVRQFLAGGASVPASRVVVGRDEPLARPPDGRGSAAYLPELVLTCGFAGGLNPDLKPGDVAFEIGDRELEIGNQLLAAGAKSARFFCADRIAVTVPEKKKLRAETAADAVEMESQAIHAVCREHKIPCATVRVVLDTANEDLPLDFNRLAKPDMSLDYRKLAWALAKPPGKIPALLRLRKNCRFAAEKLAEVLEKIIELKMPPLE
jgi:hypothetical protein